MRLFPANALDPNERRPEGRQRELPTRPLDQAHVHPPPKSVHRRWAVERVVPKLSPPAQGPLDRC